jgi:hypothetical protein
MQTTFNDFLQNMSGFEIDTVEGYKPSSMETKKEEKKYRLLKDFVHPSINFKAGDIRTLSEWCADADLEYYEIEKSTLWFEPIEEDKEITISLTEKELETFKKDLDYSLEYPISFQHEQLYKKIRKQIEKEV